MIHQIWIQGYENMPEKYKKYCRDWQNDTNFDYYFWNDNDIRNLLISIQDLNLIDAYNYFTLPQQKSDLARYAITYVYGGIYIDVDIQKGNIEIPKLILDKSLFMASDGNILYQSFYGCKQGNIVIYNCLKYISENYKRRWYEFNDLMYVQRSTGGILERLSFGNVYIIPSDLIYFCNNPDDCLNQSDKIATVHYEESWNKYKYYYNIIKIYKLILLISLIVWLYISFIKCKNIQNMCKVKNIFFYFFIGIVCIDLFLILQNIKDRSIYIYSIIYLILYYGLIKKCDKCLI